MQNLQEYLQVFKNIVEKEIINEISQQAFDKQLKEGSNALVDNEIENIVNDKKNDFKSLENKSINDIINAFKEEPFQTLTAKFKLLFKDSDINENKIRTFVLDLVDKYSKKPSNQQQLSVVNAEEEIKQFIKYDEDFEKKLQKNPLFAKLRTELSFAVTLHVRINKINIDKYIKESVFVPNSKIQTTEQRLSGKEGEQRIRKYIKFINRENKDFNPKTYNYPTKAKVLQFTLPAFHSKIGAKVCKGAGSCAAFCYAAAGQYQYPSGVFKGEFSLIFSLSKEFVKKTEAILNNKVKDSDTFYFIRIHDSGDFYSTNYLNKWFELALKFPNILFYGYTKQIKYLNLKNIPPNFKFTQSFGGRNDELLEKLVKIKSKYGIQEKELSPEDKKEIIKILDIQEEDFDESNLKQILNRLTISKVFKSEEEFEKYKETNPGIEWILVVDDDLAALDAGLNDNDNNKDNDKIDAKLDDRLVDKIESGITNTLKIGIALIVHGTNKGKLK